MRLYVWEGVLTDWTSGMIVILASSDLEAANKLDETFPYQRKNGEINGLAMEGVEPEIIDTADKTEAKVWSVYGGG